MAPDSPPDIVLLGAEWQPRALLRAQFLEEGFDVVATDTWPAVRRQLRPGSKPQLAIVDLRGLPDPERVLDELRLLMKPHRVLVIAALGTVEPAVIERLGFSVVSRPAAIGDVVAVAARVIRSADSIERCKS
jgi:hypothetical protein